MNKSKVFAVFLMTIATGLPVMGQNSLTPSLTTPLVNNDGAAQDYIQFNGSSYPSQNLICFTAGCGGEFEAQITAGPGQPVPGTSLIPVTVWCSDYQLNVTTSSAYTADVSLLSNITANDTSVQYGTLPNGSATWNNTLAVGGVGGLTFTPTGAILQTEDGGGASTAAYRFTLAAALVSQYVSNSGTPGFLNGSLTENQAIQEAIWYLTSNDTSGTDSGFDFNPNDPNGITPNVNDKNNYAYWVNYVLTNQHDVVSNLNLSQWAVISGPIVNGVVTPENIDNYNSYQTFIAEVTPEPSFYGILGAGLIGLFVARFARRRRVAL